MKEIYTPKFWLSNLHYVFKVRGRCSFLGDVAEDECGKYATRFEFWDNGSFVDFSISCKDHHRQPLRRNYV